MTQQTILRTLAITSLLVTSSGCNLEGLIPELANNAGEPTLHVQAVLHPSKTRSLPAGVDEVHIEVKDILLRRKKDQSWNILNDQSASWSIDASGSALPSFSAVPIPVGSYDAVRVVFGESSVRQSGQALELALPEEGIIQEGDWELSSDQSFEFWLDVNGVFSQGSNGTWQAEPKLELKVRNADFSNEGLGMNQGSNRDAKTPKSGSTQPL